jgi:hypothetical protein
VSHRCFTDKRLIYKVFLSTSPVKSMFHACPRANSFHMFANKPHIGTNSSVETTPAGQPTQSARLMSRANKLHRIAGCCCVYSATGKPYELSVESAPAPPAGGRSSNRSSWPSRMRRRPWRFEPARWGGPSPGLGREPGHRLAWLAHLSKLAAKHAGSGSRKPGRGSTAQA